MPSAQRTSLLLSRYCGSLRWIKSCRGALCRRLLPSIDIWFLQFGSCLLEGPTHASHATLASLLHVRLHANGCATPMYLHMHACSHRPQPISADKWRQRAKSANRLGPAVPSSSLSHSRLIVGAILKDYREASGIPISMRCHTWTAEL